MVVDFYREESDCKIRMEEGEETVFDWSVEDVVRWLRRR